MSVPSVYLMRRADRRWKFGFSADPEQRRRSLGVSFFKIVQTWETPDAWQVEQLAHRLLAAHLDERVPGKETYKAPKAVMLAAINEALALAANNPQPPPRPRKRKADKPPDPAEAARIAALVETYARKIEALHDR